MCVLLHVYMCTSAECEFLWLRRTCSCSWIVPYGGKNSRAVVIGVFWKDWTFLCFEFVGFVLFQKRLLFFPPLIKAGGSIHSIYHLNCCQNVQCGTWYNWSPLCVNEDQHLLHLICHLCDISISQSQCHANLKKWWQNLKRKCNNYTWCSTSNMLNQIKSKYMLIF